MNKNDRPILITGAARSGTSMTAGIIHYCGAFGGNIVLHNGKRASFENTYIRNNIIKPFLQNTLKVDPKGQDPLPTLRQVLGATAQQTAGLRERVVEVMKQEGLPEGAVWYYKGAKMCLIWYLWYRAFPEARWIIVRRKDEDIINSCMRTGFMNAYKKPEGWMSWVKEHKARFHEMQASSLDIVAEVWPEKIVRGDFTEIKAVIEQLGLEWNEEAVMKHIKPALWSTKSGSREEGV